jgi:deoxyribonuclease V
MQVQTLHRWDLPPREAAALQQELCARVVTRCELGAVHTVAGVDVSTAGGRARAAVVVLRFPELQPLEAATADLPLCYPYVPGLLAFREAPAVLAALEHLQCEPDLFVFDAQGRAHPRRMGLASHLGLWLERPSIGCAKSRLCGACAEPGPRVGDWAALRDGDEVIGAALRTRAGVKPVYVSVGHKIDLDSAMSYVLRCVTRYRLPEPIRWAHGVAGGSPVAGYRFPVSSSV